MNNATLPAFVLLVVVAVGHLLRFALRIELSIAGDLIPVWWSIPATILFGLAAFLLWRDSRRAVS